MYMIAHYYALISISITDLNCENVDLLLVNKSDCRLKLLCLSVSLRSPNLNSCAIDNVRHFNKKFLNLSPSGNPVHHSQEREGGGNGCVLGVEYSQDFVSVRTK